jgi:hypothetical protein
MTQQQFNIIGFESVDNKSIPIFSKFPEEFKGAWVHITPINNGKVSYLSTFYFNDHHPSGTIIVSDFILNSYPDMYNTFYLDGLAEKVYVSPRLRRKGFVGISALLLRRVFYLYLNGFLVDGSKDRAPFIEKAYIKTKKLLNEKIEENLPESAVSVYNTEPERDAVYPHIWYNQRIGGINE